MKSRKQTEFAKKWVGVVQAKAGDTVVKFTSIGKDKDGVVKPFPDGETEMKVKLSDLPKIGQRVIKPKTEGKTFRIRLNEDGDGVEEVGPVNGMFKVSFVELGPKKKDAKSATPFVKYYNKGKENENAHLEFFAVYEITEGVFKGLKLPAYNLHYKFEGVPEDDPDGLEGFTQYDTADTPKASQLHRLQNWGEIQGDIFDEPIPWEEDGDVEVSEEVLDVFGDSHSGGFANILSILEERALEADRDLNAVLENGYIKVLQVTENYEEDESEATEEVDEVDADFLPVKEEKKAPPAKKSAVKRARKDKDDEEL